MGRKPRRSWERLPKESDPAWEAFVLYRDWPVENGSRRSLQKVSTKLGKSLELMTRWSSKHEWVRRCAEYDNYLDEETIKARLKKQLEKEQEREDMRVRHVQFSIRLEKAILNTLEGLDPSETTPKQLLDLTSALQRALDIEKESRGATMADRQLELQREKFEYQKEIDAGENIEYEYLDDVETEIYGNGEGNRESGA